MYLVIRTRWIQAFAFWTHSKETCEESPIIKQKHRVMLNTFPRSRAYIFWIRRIFSFKRVPIYLWFSRVSCVRARRVIFIKRIFFSKFDVPMISTRSCSKRPTLVSFNFHKCSCAWSQGSRSEVTEVKVNVTERSLSASLSSPKGHWVQVQGRHKGH